MFVTGYTISSNLHVNEYKHHWMHLDTFVNSSQITKKLCYQCLSRVNLLRINLTRIVVMKLSIIFDRYDWKGRQIFINVKWYFRYSVPLKLYWLDYDFSKLNSNVLQKQTIFCSLWWSSIFLCRLIIFEIDLNSLIEYLFKKRISDHVLVIGLIIFLGWRKPKKLRGVNFLKLLPLVHSFLIWMRSKKICWYSIPWDIVTNCKKIGGSGVDPNTHFDILGLSFAILYHISCMFF